MKVLSRLLADQTSCLRECYLDRFRFTIGPYLEQRAGETCSFGIEQQGAIQGANAVQVVEQFDAGAVKRFFLFRRASSSSSHVPVITTGLANNRYGFRCERLLDNRETEFTDLSEGAFCLLFAEYAGRNVDSHVGN